jgi:hypothetical protein
MPYPTTPGTAPVATKKPETGQWPTDPAEMLTYYRNLLKQLAGLEDNLRTVTGDPKLEWSGGQLKSMANLKPERREQAMQVQQQLVGLREEKASIERMIPGIMKLRESQLAAQRGGTSPTQARAQEQKGLSELSTAMGAIQGQGAATGGQVAPSAGRTMIESLLGPMSDDEWSLYRASQPNLLSSVSGSLADKQQMALREQEFAFQKQQYADEMAMARAQQQQQLQQYQQNLLQQAFENSLAQRRIGVGVAGDMAGLRQQAWGQGMPWAVPGGTQYMPNFDPGGLAQQVAAAIGINLAPVPVARWDAPDPAAYYRQMGLMGQIPGPQFQPPQAAPVSTINIPLAMGGR